jgi:2'-5' RNA ligase
VRLFLALNLPSELRAAAHAAAAPLREAAPDAAWTAAEKLHLTVKFLGERPAAAVDGLAAALAPVVLRHGAQDVALGRVGAFPTFRMPRVVWLGVRPDPKLELLHHDVEVACAAVGYALEGRPFRPHVTLGRLGARGATGTADVRPLARAARGVQFRAAACITTLDVMASEPAPGGSRYTPLLRLTLTSASSGP